VFYRTAEFLILPLIYLSVIILALRGGGMGKVSLKGKKCGVVFTPCRLIVSLDYY